MAFRDNRRQSEDVASLNMGVLVDRPFREETELEGLRLLESK